MKHTKSYKLLILLLLTALLHGCIDDPVEKEGTVEGTVYDKYGMYNPFVLLSVGDYPIVSTDIFGHFTIENSTFPYNLTIVSRYSYTEKYIGITLPVSQIYTLDDYGYAGNCHVYVFFPEFANKNDHAIIKFISNDINVHFNYITFLGSNIDFDVGFRNDQNQIEGKLIFLQYTYSYGILSFEKFGMKDVVFSRGNQTITFTEEDVEYNPKELYSSFNVQLSNDFKYWESDIELNFAGMHQNSNIRLPISYGNTHSSTFVVPELPMLNYNIKFTNYASTENYLYRYNSKKWVYVQQGEDISLTHNKSLGLELPLNGETNVNDNTKFTFTDNKQGGIYVYRISADSLQNNSLDIITDKYPLEFRDFKTWKFQFEPNTTYYWSVLKYPGYKNINDFASSNVLDDSLNIEIPASELFSFKIQQ